MHDLTEARRSETRSCRQLQSELAHISRLSALGEMASALAHELNQPLAAIANYHHRLAPPAGQRAEPDAAARRRARWSARPSRSMRAGQIIRRLRDFVSRAASGARLESLSKLVEEASALAWSARAKAG